jgi:hypothetical protein
MRNPANHHGHREEELSGSVARVPRSGARKGRQGAALRRALDSPGKPVHGDGPLRLSYPLGTKQDVAALFVRSHRVRGNG